MTLLLFAAASGLFLAQLSGIVAVPAWVFVALAVAYALGRLVLRRTRWWFEFGGREDG